MMNLFSLQALLESSLERTTSSGYCGGASRWSEFCYKNSPLDLTLVGTGKCSYLGVICSFETHLLQATMASSTSAPRNEKDLNENFLTMLTCSSCALYLSAPIYQCWSGHSFCSHCFATHLKCPMCKMTFVKCRNVSLEMITRNFLFPCKNRTEGCKAKFRLHELYQHEKICPRQKLCDCAIGKYGDRSCSWKGPYSNVWLHVKDVHPTKLFLCESIECVVKDFDPTDNFTSVLLIRALGESFWYYNQQDKKKNAFLGAAQYIGPKYKALKYKYETDFCSKNQSDFKLSFSRLTHHDGTAIEDIFSSEQCMSLRSSMLNNLVLEDNSLHFYLRLKTA